MSNALKDLFTDQANAIREGLGDIGMIAPADFPAKTREIVALIGSGGGSSADVCYVTFMSYDGLTEHGRLPVAKGYDCPNPKFTPTRESTAQYSYVHAGWATEANGALDSNALKEVNEDRTVYANFAAVVRYYTISFYDGETLLTTQSVAYGSTPSYTPTKDGYDFVSWEPSVAAVTGDASYTAKWKVKAQFSTATWDEIIEVAQSGNAASTFAVGDKRTETINYADGTSEQITWVVASLNKTCTTVDGNKDNVTIAATHTLATSRKIYNSSMTGYYEQSNLATYLNGDFYNALPESLRSGIKEVYTRGSGYQAQKVWILSLYDLGLSKTNYAAGVATGPLEYFNSDSRRIMKKGANGSATAYMTRSVKHSGNYSYFAKVTTAGTVHAGEGDLANGANPFVPCFCI